MSHCILVWGNSYPFSEWAHLPKPDWGLVHIYKGPIFNICNRHTNLPRLLFTHPSKTGDKHRIGHRAETVCLGPAANDSMMKRILAFPCLQGNRGSLTMWDGHGAVKAATTIKALPHIVPAMLFGAVTSFHRDGCSAAAVNFHVTPELHPRSHLAAALAVWEYWTLKGNQEFITLHQL